jgi:PAS domain S-box-containing protein
MWVITSLFLLSELRRGGYEVISERVETPEDMAAILDGASWDVVVSDYFVPGFGALEALALLKEKNLDLPFIVISGKVGEEAAAAAMRAGAHDYVMKNNLTRLGVAIERELREAEDRREKRRVERALRESEQQFRATFDLSPIGMAHVAPDGRWLRVNAKLLETLGYEREELLERTFQDVTHPEDLDNDLRYVHRMLKGKLRTYSIEKRYIRKDGSHVWICLSVSLVREGRSYSGEPEYFISAVQDISERKLAELIPEPLSSQEISVLKLLMRGETNQQIADELSYSLGGIKLIVRHVLAKLGVKSREKAAFRAVEIGLLPPRP